MRHIIMKRKLKFYNNINEALLADNLDYDTESMHIKQIIEVNKCGEDMIIFFTATQYKEDYFYLCKIKLKEYLGQTYYSNTVLSQSFLWKNRRKYMSNITRNENKIEKLINLIRDDILRCTGTTEIKLGDNKIRWGVALNPDVKKLTIQNIEPTKISEIQLEQDKVYFWYYEDWKENDDYIQRLKIRF